MIQHDLIWILWSHQLAALEELDVTEVAAHHEDAELDARKAASECGKERQSMQTLRAAGGTMEGSRVEYARIQVLRRGRGACTKAVSGPERLHCSIMIPRGSPSNFM